MVDEILQALGSTLKASKGKKLSPKIINQIFAKFRAARRLYAKLMRDRFGAKNERSMMLRFHAQTAGSTLTAQQPDVNVIRTSLQAMAAVLGEAITRPDAEFVRAATGFAIGGVPPLGHAVALATFMDEDLLQYETIWAAAGTPYAVFAVSPTELQAAVGATIIRVT